MTTPAYDSENIFAKILRGEIPSHKVYEDDMTVAIMDIMPRADGHTLVIPKNASRNMLDVATEDINAVMATTQKIAQAQMIAFEADGITIQQFNESAGGQVIFHLHMHIIPRKEGVSLRPHTGDMADGDLLAQQAEKLRAVLDKM
ncbi:HIT family protein [Cohaesibacter celericrescens]|uniref:HIT family protein n=1 Tax=Cohaesibacter celericrescens TaxID=2067669 RepID=UPI00356A3323